MSVGEEKGWGGDCEGGAGGEGGEGGDGCAVAELVSMLGWKKAGRGREGRGGGRTAYAFDYAGEHGCEEGGIEVAVVEGLDMLVVDWRNDRVFKAEGLQLVDGLSRYLDLPAFRVSCIDDAYKFEIMSLVDLELVNNLPV